MTSIFCGSNDPTVDIILLYLRRVSGQKNQRFNKDNTILSFTHLISNCNNKIKFKTYNFNYVSEENSSCFFRRGELLFPLDYYKNSILRIEKFKKKELDVISEAFFFSLLAKKKRFGGYFEEKNNNKIIQLQVCTSLGIKIPDTIISTQKKDLVAFIKKYKNCIIKPITNQTYYQDYFGNNWHSKGTARICFSDLDSIKSDQIFPSLIQQEIEKKFEVRTFFFNDNFWSMAIFSQNNDNTKLDYRNYDREKPYRFVPYKLRKSTEKKVLQVIKKIGMTTGSFDFIVDKNGDEVFLEINPSGQFSMVSSPCNFYIEKFIANYLNDEKNH